MEGIIAHQVIEKLAQFHTSTETDAGRNYTDITRAKNASEVLAQANLSAEKNIQTLRDAQDGLQKLIGRASPTKEMHAAIHNIIERITELQTPPKRKT